MTYLRKRMIEDLQLRGMGIVTQQRYVRAVQQLAEHYGKSPTRSQKRSFAITSSTSKTSRSGPGAPAQSLYAASSSFMKIRSNATGLYFT